MRYIYSYFKQLLNYPALYWAWANKVMAIRSYKLKLRKAIHEAKLLTEADGKKRWVINDFNGDPIILTRVQLKDYMKKGVIPKMNIIRLSEHSHYTTR